MDGITLRAPAKINLVLDVDPLGADGYHPIRSLMAELPDIYDTVTVTQSDRRSVTCAGVAERDNLAWRALDALERHIGQPLPLAVVIEKQIPSETGLGGGSSDAAATLKAARTLLWLPLSDDELEQIGAHVGSDVPFFIRGGVQWATGRGERLQPGTTEPCWAVVVREDVGLSTARVYEHFDRLPPLPRVELASREFNPLREARNDLWQAARSLVPGLGGVAEVLRSAGASRVLLCGSGSSVAGLVADASSAEATAARVAALRPGMWCRWSRVASTVGPTTS